MDCMGTGQAPEISWLRSSIIKQVILLMDMTNSHWGLRAMDHAGHKEALSIALCPWIAMLQKQPKTENLRIQMCKVWQEKFRMHIRA